MILALFVSSCPSPAAGGEVVEAGDLIVATTARMDADNGGVALSLVEAVRDVEVAGHRDRSGRAGTPDEVGTVGPLLMGTEGAFIIGSDFLVEGASPLAGAVHTLTEVVPPSEIALIGGLAVMTGLRPTRDRSSRNCATADSYSPDQYNPIVNWIGGMDWQCGEADMAGAVARNNVTVEGRSDGQPMLFAHGFGCSQDMWRRMAPAFSDDYRLVLFDHVGAGGSDVTAYDREKYSELDGYASDLLEVCDELRLEQVILVAHSVSAMIAVIAAVREPVRFWRLVLVAPSPCYIDDPESGYVGGFSREDIEGLLESVNSNYVGWAQAIAPLVMGNPQFPELTAELSRSFVSTVPQIAQEFARVTFMTDSRHLLEMVSTPALVLQCSEDALVPDSVGGYIHEHMGGSTLVKLEATGHCPHVSAPDETTAAVARYLEAAHPLPF